MIGYEVNAASALPSSSWARATESGLVLKLIGVPTVVHSVGCQLAIALIRSWDPITFSSAPPAHTPATGLNCSGTTIRLFQ